MKALTILTAASILFVSCNTMSFNRAERRDLRKIYVYDFKAIYFRKMLISGFRNSKEINSVIGEDHSVYSEQVLSMDDFNFLDSLIAEDTKRLIADSVAGINRAEGAQGKRVFNFALDRYQSKWFNKIALQRSRGYTDVRIVAGK